MIKLFASDIDHTLYCSEDREIPKRTVEAINRLLDEGITVALASSRNFEGVMKTVDLFDLRNRNGYVIVNNGAYVVRLRDNKVLVNARFNKEEIAYLYNEAKKYNLGFMFLTENKCISTNFCKILEYNLSHVDMDIILTSRILENYFEDDVRQMAFFDDQQNMYELYDKLDPELKEKYNFNVPQPVVMDIAVKTANKFSGLQAVMADLGVDASETAATGDNDNDVPMLLGVGISGCVGNGSVDAKKAAKVVLATDKQCGVADFIDQYILNKEIKND